MEKQAFNIPNISCGHCVMAIKNELQEMNGVQQVDGDPAAKTITVQWEAPVSAADIKAKLNEIGYPATG